MLIDVAMWPLNGTEVTRKLTREGRSIRFLFMSGSAGLGMLDAPALDGLTWAFLPKPFTAEQLTAALKNLKGCGKHEHANDETTT